MSSAVLNFPICETKDVEPCSSEDTKPSLESYDSADECSYAHLVHVYEIIELKHQLLDRNVFDDECSTWPEISA